MSLRSIIASFFRRQGINPDNFAGEELDSVLSPDMDYDYRVELQEAGVRNIQPSGEEQTTSWSSNVAWVRYDAINDALYLGFDNRRGRGVRVYLYHELRDHGFNTPEIFASIATAASPGHVVWEELRRSGAPFVKL